MMADSSARRLAAADLKVSDMSLRSHTTCKQARQTVFIAKENMSLCLRLFGP